MFVYIYSSSIWSLLSVHPAIHTFSLPTHLSTAHPHILPSIHLSIQSTIHPSLNTSIHSTIHPTIHLSTHPSTFTHLPIHSSFINPLKHPPIYPSMLLSLPTYLYGYRKELAQSTSYLLMHNVPQN